MNFSYYNNSIHKYLKEMIVTDNNGNEFSQDEGFNKWIQETIKVSKNNKNIFLVGNGASAMMASHMAADATKNGRLRALSFNDPALMTAISNDNSYENVFSTPLKRFANEGDMLITISSSGNSQNVIESILSAKELSMEVITISGMETNNKSRQLGDLNFYVPAQTYGEIECTHQIVLHFWLDKYMKEVGISI